MQMESAIARHWGRPSILENILQALAQAGVDPKRPSYLDIVPYDQLHARGIEATREHLARAEISAEMHVLDLGCGVGGASRYIAATTGARVTGVDLTPEFVEAAQSLTSRCGLEPKVTFQQGNALALPFSDGSFDRVWVHNVTMNIPDKELFASEVGRVLKTGGRLTCWEMALGHASEPIYPLPWASDSSTSFLLTPDTMRRTLANAGLDVIADIDRSDAHHLDIATMMMRGALPGNKIIRADDFRIRVQNSGRSAAEGRLVEHLIVAIKRGS